MPDVMPSKLIIDDRPYSRGRDGQPRSDKPSSTELSTTSVSSVDVYEKIEELQTILYQMRGERNARMAEFDNPIRKGTPPPCRIHKITPPSKKSTPRTESSGGGRSTPQSKPSIGTAMTIYERTKIHLVEKERRIEALKQEMMEECTFFPETNHSLPHRGSSLSSRGSSWCRLHRKSNLRSSPDLPVQKRNIIKLISRQTGSTGVARASPKSLEGGEATKTNMDRIYELYREGAAKQRPLSNKEEDKIRENRHDQGEMEHCTFQPKMVWGRDKSKDWPRGKPNEVDVTANKDDFYSPVSMDQSMGSLTSNEDLPPVEIIATLRVASSYITPPKVDPFGFVVSPITGAFPTHSSAERENDVNKSLEPAFHAIHDMDIEYGSI